jgi:Apea-like HEPN
MLDGARRFMHVQRVRRSKMPLEEVRRALRAAENALKPKVSELLPIGAHFPMAPEDKRQFLPEVLSLVEAVRDAAELREATAGILLVPGASVPYGPERLSQWLATQAVQFGSKVALERLERFISTESIPSKCICTIVGLKLTRPCVVDETTRLVPFDDLEETPKKHAVRLRAFDQMRYPAAALVREVTVKKRFVEPTQMAGTTVLAPEFAQENDDIVLCAGLFGPTGPSFDSSWWELPDWLPIFGASYAHTGFSSIVPTADWPEDAYATFPAFYSTFRTLGQKRKSQFRIPMERLNASMHPLSPANAAIDCRIALESLFLSSEPKDHGELKYRLRLRASRFLGSEFEERKNLFQMVGNLYDLGSAAVHTGSIEESDSGVTVKDLLTAGQAMIALATRKLIALGRVDWPNVELE